MRIATFNVRHGRTRAGLVRTGALARYCARLQAEVLALQEVDDGVRRSLWADQAGATARTAGMAHVFGPARRLGRRGRYGNALLVSGSVDEAEVVSLPRVGRREPRAAIVASVAVGGDRLSVAATHLSTSGEESRRQLEAVLAALVGRPPPRLLLGDLNLGSDEVGPMVEAAGLSLADPAAPTFPARVARARIDHVATEGLDVIAVEVLPRPPVSDHRPLAVEASVVTSDSSGSEN